MNYAALFFGISLLCSLQQVYGAARVPTRTLQNDIYRLARGYRGTLQGKIANSSHRIETAYAVDGSGKLHVTITVFDSSGETRYEVRDFITVMGPFFKALIQRFASDFGDILIAESPGAQGAMQFTGYQELNQFMTDLNRDSAGTFRVEPPLFDGAVSSFRITTGQSGEYTAGQLTKVADVIFRDGPLDGKDEFFGRLMYDGPCISLTENSESIFVGGEYMAVALFVCWVAVIFYMIVECHTPFCT